VRRQDVRARFDEILTALGDVPYDETSYRALVELAEEMRGAWGYAEYHHPDLAKTVKRIRAVAAALVEEGQA